MTPSSPSMSPRGFSSQLRFWGSPIGDAFDLEVGDSSRGADYPSCSGCGDRPTFFKVLVGPRPFPRRDYGDFSRVAVMLSPTLGAFSGPPTFNTPPFRLVFPVGFSKPAFSPPSPLQKILAEHSCYLQQSRSGGLSFSVCWELLAHRSPTSGHTPGRNKGLLRPSSLHTTSFFFFLSDFPLGGRSGALASVNRPPCRFSSRTDVLFFSVTFANLLSPPVVGGGAF